MEKLVILAIKDLKDPRDKRVLMDNKELLVQEENL